MVKMWMVIAGLGMMVGGLAGCDGLVVGPEPADEAAAEVAVEVAPIAAEATEPAEGAEPLYYANGPCGRTPTLWKYFYGYAPARNLHDCNKRALEESRRTGLWLFSAWRNSTGECCLFLQPNSRH